MIVFLDVSQGENPLGRIKIQLNNELLPRTCENFRQLCTGEYRENGKPLGYKGCKFHRVIKDFMIQGGDFVRGNGQGSFSIYGEMFNDEGFPLDHKKYSVSMANSGPNTNGCQFFICTDNTPHLDGKHVVFGKVIEGFETVDVINRVRVKGDTPVEPIIVTNCGEY
ncbi:peptidyl-prolyl cis-trans isomerase [[Candida] anglica]|uniref:Peptidyl-prolyl cis-trans isomerase n=1 Tax=[Candida] anglica TaxID=148631 RepID=A0ABP0EH26_9ASCO